MKQTDTKIDKIIVTGKYFTNCTHKGRLAEFRNTNLPFHRATVLEEEK